MDKKRNVSVELELPNHIYRQNGIEISDDLRFAFTSREILYIYSPFRYIFSPEKCDLEKLESIELPTPNQSFPAKINFPQSKTDSINSNLNFISEICNRSLFNTCPSYGNSYTNQVRHLAWSPANADPYGRSILGIVNMDGDAYFLRIHPTYDYHQFITLRNRFLSFLATKGRNHEELKSSKGYKKDFIENYLNFEGKSAVSAIQFLEDFKISSIEFIHPLFTRDKSRHLLFLTLSKSGMLTFWQSDVPIVTDSSFRIFLTETDHTKQYENSYSNRKEHLIHFKVFSHENYLLILKVLSNGNVLLSIYSADIKSDSFNFINISNENILKTPIPCPTVNCFHYCPEDRLLLFSYNFCIVKICVNFVNFDHKTCIHEIPNVCLPITGMTRFEDHVYITVQDGIILKTDTDFTSDNWEKVIQSNDLETNSVPYWQFYGSYTGKNNCSLYFLAEPENFLECTASSIRSKISSKLLRLSILSDDAIASKLSDIICKGGKVSKFKLDLLTEIFSKFQKFEISSQTDCQSPIVQIIRSKVLEVNSQPLERLIKDKFDSLQISWYFSKFAQNYLVENVDISKNIRNLEFAITLNRILYSIQLFFDDEKRTNLADSNQLQEISVFLLSLERKSDENSPFFEINPEFRKSIMSIAMECYEKCRNRIRYTFKRAIIHKIEDNPKCPLCQKECNADIFQLDCKNGHHFFRCPQTLMIMVSKNFRTCTQCSRNYLWTDNNNSSWHSAVCNNKCIFCDVDLAVFRD